MGVQEDDDVTGSQLCAAGAGPDQTLPLLVTVQSDQAVELLDVVFQFVLQVFCEEKREVVGSGILRRSQKVTEGQELTLIVMMAVEFGA